MSSVVVYSIPGCVQCDWTVRKLKEQGVVPVLVDLSAAPQAMAMVRAMGFTAAPVVTDGATWWSGFDLAKIRAVTHREAAPLAG